MKSYTDKLFYINFFYVIPGIAFNVTKNNYFNLSNCPLFRNGKPVLIFFLKTMMELLYSGLLITTCI